ncbi:MAG TPA: radical SAM protein [Steroidobacter sp.]|uniref:radical SAM protein n=1 Tax=Steroidobacter sp. TaxID=1978227 RepID=UPI002EDB6F70
MIVVWRVTTRCNLGCGYCAYDRELPLSRTEIDAATVLRFAGVLSKYRTLTGNAVMISWLGGEPLLWKPLASLSKVLTEELRLQLSATTNGTALKSAPMRALIAGHFTELTVSVDGPSSFHDQIRKWPGGFEQLRAGVAQLRADAQHREQRLRLRINTVLMEQNIHLFSELCEQLLSWDIDEITFNQLGGNDRPDFHREHRLQPAHVEALAIMLPVLRERLRVRGIRLNGGVQYLQRFRASASGEQLRIASCSPGKNFLFIDEHGRAAPCSFTTPDYAVRLDELRSVDDLLALNQRYEQAVAQRRSRWCDDCPSTQVFEKFVD